MTKFVVAALQDMPPGTRKLVNVKGRPIAVFNVKGEFFGLLNRCPHQGGSLIDGKLIGLVEAPEPGQYQYSRHGEILRCPWHGWEFDIRDGRSRCDPQKIKARAYDVSVTAGSDLAEKPLIAETISVTVEDSYVVVEI